MCRKSAGWLNAIKQATQGYPMQNPVQAVPCGPQSNDGASHGLTTMSLNSCNSTSSAVQAALADPLSVGALQQSAVRPTQPAYTQPSSIHSVHSHHTAQTFASQPCSTQSTAKHHSVATGVQGLMHNLHALSDSTPAQNYHSVHASMDLTHKAQHATAAANRSGMPANPSMPQLAAPLQVSSSSTLSADPVSVRSQEVWGSLTGMIPPGSAASSAVARSPPDSKSASAQRSTWSLYLQQPNPPAYTGTSQPLAAISSHQSSSFSPPMPMERIVAPVAPALVSEPASQQDSELSGQGGPSGTGISHTGASDAAANATAAWVASAMHHISRSSFEPMPPAPQSGSSTAGNSSSVEHHKMDAQLVALVAQVQQEYGNNVTLGLLENALGRALSPAEAIYLQHAFQALNRKLSTDDHSTKAQLSGAHAQGGSGATTAHVNSVFVHPEDMRKCCWGHMQTMLASHGTVNSGTDYGLDSPTTQMSLKALEGPISMHGASAPGSYRHSASPDNAGHLTASTSGGIMWDPRSDSMNSGVAAQSPSEGAQLNALCGSSCPSQQHSPLRDAAMQDIGGEADVWPGRHRYAAGVGTVNEEGMMDALCSTLQQHEQLQRAQGQMSGQLEPVAEGFAEVQHAFMLAHQRWGKGQRDSFGGVG
jgi:hypothetical protein